MPGARPQPFTTAAAFGGMVRRASEILDPAHRRRISHHGAIRSDQLGAFTLGLGQQRAVERVGVQWRQLPHPSRVMWLHGQGLEGGLHCSLSHFVRFEREIRAL